MTLFDLIDATWPAECCAETGGFLLRFTKGGGSRVSAATLRGNLEAVDIDAAIDAMHAAGQRPLFMIRPGDDALDAELARRGYTMQDPTIEFTAPLAALAGEVPPVTAFAHWPPLQIAREVWDETDIGAARQAIMERVAGPKTCVLGRIDDRAAGAAFVAVAGETAMLHALTILTEKRRKGLARAMMHEAVHWAMTEGATRLSLIVREDNAAAVALYEGLGMARGQHYHYRVEASE